MNIPEQNGPQIHFILVNPQNPGNIGASARALKTMGFAGLRLVSDREISFQEEYRLAHGAQEFIENIEIFSSLQTAIEDCDFKIGTTTRKRHFPHHYVESDQIPRLLTEKSEAVSKVAMIFGCETNGLKNEDLMDCDIISQIPIKTEYPSLNLSQAVMIYAYTLRNFNSISPINISKEVRIKGQHKTVETFQYFKEKIAQHLLDQGYPSGDFIHQKALKRIAMLDLNDMKLILDILRGNRQDKH